MFWVPFFFSVQCEMKVWYSLLLLPKPVQGYKIVTEKEAEEQEERGIRRETVQPHRRYTLTVQSWQHLQFSDNQLSVPKSIFLSNIWSRNWYSAWVYLSCVTFLSISIHHQHIIACLFFYVLYFTFTTEQISCFEKNTLSSSSQWLLKSCSILNISYLTSSF